MDLLTVFGRSPIVVGQVLFTEPTARPHELGCVLEFGVELTIPEPACCVAAFVRAAFTDARIRAIDLSVRTESVASVHALPGGLCGWQLGSPVDTVPIPRQAVISAVLEVPPEISTVTGGLRVDATVLRPSPWSAGRRRHATTEPGEFRLAVPAGRRPVRVQPRARTGTAGVRLCVAADVERFSRFTMPEAERAQRRFIDVLAAARRHAGIDSAELQESGDGQFAVLPPGLDESVVIPKLVEGLRIGLAQSNADLNEHARLRLRVALHRGHIAPGVNGWVGDAPIAVHRLLDAPPVRDALAGTPATDFVLVVPDVLYDDVIAHRHGLLDPDEFHRVEIDLPAKNFRGAAWVYAPDR